MRDPKKEKKSKKELRRMLKSITRDQKDFWLIGKFACRKVLADGTIVAFSITEPAHKVTPARKPKAPKRDTKRTTNGAATHA